MAHHPVTDIYIDGGNGELLMKDTEGRAIIINPRAAFKQDRKSGTWMRIDIDYKAENPWEFQNRHIRRHRGNPLTRWWTEFQIWRHKRRRASNDECE